MAGDYNPFGIIVYAPPPLSDYARVLATVRGLERAGPGVRLDWEVAEGGRPVALPRRDEWLAEAVARGEFPLLCNGDESYPVTISGHETSAMSAPGGRPWVVIDADLPLEQAIITVAMDIVQGVGDGACAFWGVGHRCMRQRRLRIRQGVRMTTGLRRAACPG